MKAALKYQSQKKLHKYQNFLLFAYSALANKVSYNNNNDIK